MNRQTELLFDDAPPPAAAARAAELRREIERHNRLYYQDAAPEISDFEYDALLRELEALEKKYPALAAPDSPTRRVGGAPQSGFAPLRHAVPMMSLANTYNDAELGEFDTRVRKLLGGAPFTYLVEPKVDGVAVTAHFENGRFVRGGTRGDGRTGDDITANLRTLRGWPERLDPRGGPPPPRLEARGEVYLPRAAFAEINREREEAGEPLFANPRNAAAGSLKQLDPRIVAARPLAIVLYALGDAEGFSPATQAELLDRFAAWGLPVTPRRWVCDHLADVRAALEELRALRDELPFATDGGVIKVNERAHYDALGETAKSPRWAVAFKYEPERAETRLNAVTLQVGRTGVITPVAELEPVALAGSTVARATLHNFEEIARKDLRIGDRVWIEKAGEVIPAVVGVNAAARDGRERTIAPPDACPVCGGPVGRRPEEVALRCENLQCPAQAKRWLLHAAARGALNIEGLGEALVEQLVDRGLARTPADFFALDAERLLPLDRMGEKSVARLLEQIAAARSRDLARWIFALGIPQVGAGLARTLGAHFASLDDLAAADETRLVEIPDVGETVAAEIARYFRSSRAGALLETLRAAGVRPARVEGGAAAGPLSGKQFVLTGTLVGFTREQAAEEIRARGGVVGATVVKKTHYLVAGENPGSKLEKARKFGVTVLDEAGFRELLNAEVVKHENGNA